MDIIFSLNTRQGNNQAEFGSILIRELDFIAQLSLRKKIISCSIELIQNNLKHNSQTAIFVIAQDINYYSIRITESIKDETYQSLLTNISAINAMGSNELRSNYQSNLSKDKENTGNGFLLCRLKSSDAITIIGQSSDIPNYTNTSISIKFKKL